MSTPARRFGQVAGSVYTALGLLGFAVTGLAGFAATTGPILFGLRLNPLHNTLHLLIGVALVIAAARGEDEARTISMLTAAAYGVVGLLGLALVGTDGNVLALNHPDNVLHLLTAVVATLATIASRDVPEPSTT
ncbi:MAG: DUF4383 domain-containing protein [Actinobacteria bacterium]|nr:DUF4383 domain-containing protein [Actinomycetota bacterium]